MKKSHGFGFVILTLFTLTRCGYDERFARNDSSKLAGVWNGVPPTTAAVLGIPVSIKTLLRLDKNRVTVIAICEYPDGGKVVASVSSCAIFGESTISNIQQTKHIENLGDRQCSAEIDFGSLNYRYDRGILTVWGPSKRWTLIRSENQTEPSSIPHCGR